MKHQTRLPEGATPIPPRAPLSAPDAIDTTTLDLLERWRREDATDDSEEIQAAEQELAEFQNAMNETRRLAGEPPLYP